MSRLFLPTFLCERGGGGVRSPLEVNAASVGEILQEVTAQYPGLRGWVVDDAGRLRQHVKVFVNDAEATLATPVSGEDEIHVVPAISGGGGASST